MAVGYLALSSDDVGQHNVAIGRQALENLNIATASNTYNVAVGSNAGNALTTGVQNTFIGGLAGDAQTAASNNTALGYGSLSTETNGSRNVAIGVLALESQNTSGGGNIYNTAVGALAGQSVTTGINNTCYSAGNVGEALTDADFNVALGTHALTADTLGSKSTALGYFALGNQNFTTATDTFNTAVGYHAGLAVTTAVQNTLIGGKAGDALTTGDSNVAVGVSALTSDTKGERAVAIGEGSLHTQNFSTSTNNYNVRSWVMTLVSALQRGASTSLWVV